MEIQTSLTPRVPPF